MSKGQGSGSRRAQPTALTYISLDSIEETENGAGLDLKGRAGLRYTGKSDEDREAFVRKFVEFVEEFRRAHESRIRRQMKSAALFMSLSAQQQKDFKNSKPDYRAIWELIPIFLAGDDSSTSVTYEWWLAVDGDADGEVSGEWRTVGPSIKGLTGVDETEETHYFWALRGFIAALEAKLLMKGTKEKQDLLLAKPQTAEQDGLTFVKLCQRREAAVHAGVVVPDEVVRQNILECIKMLRIKEFRDRVAEQVRSQYPAPDRVTWNNLEVIVEVQDKLKNDAETWSLKPLQDLNRRASDVYACWEMKQHGIDLVELLATVKRAAAGKRDTGRKGSAAGPSESTKKQDKEVNYAEKAAGRYSKVPPPGCRSPEGMPENFWEKRKNSPRENERKNYALRKYNLEHVFPKQEMGITPTAGPRKL
ncbi:hypothetical protein CYMTET_7401 [Cymbomonas tetramitiformis]|uniref:Uncharacterized protein n=1 Tax=Cymbomonas tetramitiformis TaxID=36881 RepID=A0AAE0GVK6_9CHLO|nr:hypothetical protein CYMTET_7401 [Cymbomonas tetramitiformis]